MYDEVNVHKVGEVTCTTERVLKLKSKIREASFKVLVQLGRPRLRLRRKSIRKPLTISVSVGLRVLRRRVV